MKKPIGFIAKSALILALPLLCGGCRAVLKQFAPPPNSAASNSGTPNFRVNVPPPGMTPSAVRVPASMALTERDVPLEKIALPKPSAAGVASLNRQNARADAWVKKMRAEFLPDADSGEGLVICEPIIQGASTRKASNGFDAANFGAGCSRWLFVQVGGRGELGKTPIWGAVEDVRLLHGFRDLRLAPPQAAQLATSTGATRVATARFSGDGDRGTLSYQLWKADGKTKIGAPFSVSGSAAQIVAGLPQLAAQMAQQLGASTRGLQSAVGTDAAGLTFLGKVPWKNPRDFSETDSEKLRVLAARVPLAALLYVRDGNASWGDPRQRAAVASALNAAPDNVLLLTDFMWNAVDDARPFFARIDAGISKYPSNALLNLADACRWRRLGDLKRQRVASEAMVSCAPQSPMAWMSLGSTIQDIAHEMRRGRGYQGMSDKEQGYLTKLYDNHLFCALHSAQLAPIYAAWSDVAQAASFASDADLADLALWKSLAIERRGDAYYWGFQMYRGNWFPDADKLQLLVKMAYADRDLTRYYWDDAVDGLSSLDLDVKAQRQLLYTVGLFEDRLKAHPDDGATHLALAYLARDKGHDGSKDAIAIREFRAAMELLPNDPAPMEQLGEMLHYKKRQYAQAEKLYRDALKLNPTYPNALKCLGNLTYYVHHDAAGAETLYRRAIALAPDEGIYHAELARLLLDQGKRAAALTEARAAIAQDYVDSGNEIFTRLQLDPIAEWRQIVAQRDEKLFQF